MRMAGTQKKLTTRIDVAIDPGKPPEFIRMHERPRGLFAGRKKEVWDAQLAEVREVVSTACNFDPFFARLNNELYRTIFDAAAGKSRDINEIIGELGLSLTPRSDRLRAWHRRHPEVEADDVRLHNRLISVMCNPIAARQLALDPDVDLPPMELMDTLDKRDGGVLYEPRLFLNESLTVPTMASNWVAGDMFDVQAKDRKTPIQTASGLPTYAILDYVEATIALVAALRMDRVDACVALPLDRNREGKIGYVSLHGLSMPLATVINNDDGSLLTINTRRRVHDPRPGQEIEEDTMIMPHPRAVALEVLSDTAVCAIMIAIKAENEARIMAKEMSRAAYESAGRKQRSMSTGLNYIDLDTVLDGARERAADFAQTLTRAFEVWPECPWIRWTIESAKQRVASVIGNILATNMSNGGEHELDERAIDDIKHEKRVATERLVGAALDSAFEVYGASNAAERIHSGFLDSQ